MHTEDATLVADASWSERIKEVLSQLENRIFGNTFDMTQNRSMLARTCVPTAQEQSRNKLRLSQPEASARDRVVSKIPH